MRGRLAAVIVAAGALMLLSASIANAATVSVITASDPPFNPVAVFAAEPGETNLLDVNMVFEPGVFTDSGALLEAGDGCVSLGPNSASCLPPSLHVDAYLRDGDDRALVVVNSVARVFGGGGNDVLSADSFAGATFVYGEAGNDNVEAAGEGGQLANGGPGDDLVGVFAFGGQSTGIGGNGDDIITFRHAVNTSIGPAELDGGNGDDTIHAQPPWSGVSTATGGSGNDTIAITTVPPLFGTGSSFLLIGGPGNDTLTGGVSIDSVDGGTGDDSIDVAGGGADTVTCGAGDDLVHADATDTVAGDCEVVLS